VSNGGRDRSRPAADVQQTAMCRYHTDRQSGARWRTLIKLGMDVGLRPGELYRLHGHRVDWRRGKLPVVDVMTRQGLRQRPRSKLSHRVVPVPARTLERMSADVGSCCRRNHG